MQKFIANLIMPLGILWLLLISLQQQHAWQRIGLISSASHLPRALALASRVGCPVIPLGADWLGQPHAFRLQDTVPHDHGFRLCHLACWEWVGVR